MISIRQNFSNKLELELARMICQLIATRIA